MTLTATVPERSFRQRMDALGRANRVRSQRSELKRVLASKPRGIGLLLVIECLEDDRDWLQTMKVVDLLAAVQGVGTRRVNVLVKRVGMSHSKTVAGLSDRQRDALVTILKRAAHGQPLPLS